MPPIRPPLVPSAFRIKKSTIAPLTSPLATLPVIVMFELGGGDELDELPPPPPPPPPQETSRPVIANKIRRMKTKIE